MVSVRALVAAIAFAAVPVVAITPQQVAERLGDLTSGTKALEAPAQNITGENAGLINVNQGPAYMCYNPSPLPACLSAYRSVTKLTTHMSGDLKDVASGLDRVYHVALALASKVASYLEGTPTTDDATGIASAYQELANAQIDLVKILSAKSSVVSLAPGVGQRMADALERDRTALNELTRILAIELPEQVIEIWSAFRSLSDWLVPTIAQYRTGR